MVEYDKPAEKPSKTRQKQMNVDFYTFFFACCRQSWWKFPMSVYNYFIYLSLSFIASFAYLQIRKIQNIFFFPESI